MEDVTEVLTEYLIYISPNNTLFHLVWGPLAYVGNLATWLPQNIMRCWLATSHASPSRITSHAGSAQRGCALRSDAISGSRVDPHWIKCPFLSKVATDYPAPKHLDSLSRVYKSVSTGKMAPSPNVYTNTVQA